MENSACSWDLDLLNGRRIRAGALVQSPLRFGDGRLPQIFCSSPDSDRSCSMKPRYGLDILAHNARYDRPTKNSPSRLKLMITHPPEVAHLQFLQDPVMPPKTGFGGGGVAMEPAAIVSLASMLTSEPPRPASPTSAPPAEERIAIPPCRNYGVVRND